MKLRRALAVMLGMILAAGIISSTAEGTILHTVSCFAGDDAAAGVYVEILNRFESETGNTVRDRSSASDEAWKTSVLNDFAAGKEPDPGHRPGRTPPPAAPDRFRQRPPRPRR